MNQEGGDHSYTQFWTEMKTIGAQKVIQTVWAAPSNGKSAAALRDRLKPHIADGDRLLVGVVEDWATRAAAMNMNDL